MKKKILVADDNRDIAATVKIVLETYGFDVALSNDGAECLSQIKKTNPDLILLDLKMPGMTTKEIISEFKKMKLRIPIILFSASRAKETKESIEKIETNGFKIADYIEKPFSNADLVSRIKKALKMKEDA